jgi:acetyl-CoA carboxylase biotin carboxyl carrier protein
MYYEFPVGFKLAFFFAHVIRRHKVCILLLSRDNSVHSKSLRKQHLNGEKMSDKPSFDEAIVRQLAKILKDTDLTEIEYELDKCRIRVARQTAGPVGVANIAIPSQTLSAPSSHMSAVPQPAATAEQDLSSHPGALKAPMVGTIYRAPTPGAANFVELGSTVKKDQTVIIIEAMKVMNQIRAPKDGKVAHILCKDTDPVEYGQVLMVIE